MLLLPDVVISGSLQGGQPVGMPVILASFGLPADGVPSGLTVSDAGFSASPVIGAYSADLTLDQVWPIGPVTLDQAVFSVSYDRTDGFAGLVEGTLTIGSSIQIVLQAAYAGPPQGWMFSGSTVPGAVLAVGDLITMLASSYGITTVPAVLGSLTLSGVAASYETGTGNMTFTCTGGLTVAGVPVSLVLTAAVTGTAQTPPGDQTVTGSAGYSATYGGQLTIGPLAFSAVYDLSGTGTDITLGAVWQAPAGQPYLGVPDLAAALGLSTPPLPDGLDLRLSAASLTINVTKGQFVVSAQSATYGNAAFVATPVTATASLPPATEFFLMLAAGQTIDLSDLPLLGEVLTPQDTCAVEALTVVVASTSVDATTAQAVNQLVPSGYPQLPAAGTSSAVALSATLRFGVQTFPVTLGTPAQAGGTSTAATTKVGAPQGGNAVVSTPPAQSDGTAWFSVQKAFGPITFERVGARYADGKLWFLLDASLVAGGLSLSLQGASVASPITTFSPRFDLRGLAVAYSNPPLSIGGAFASVTPTGGATFEYDGAVVVSLPQWGVTAYGSYAEIGGEPSMFVFLQVRGAFGGPPAFFVTGLAGGFGYNSSVRIPAPDEVIAFPLVGGLSNPALLGGSTATPMQALTALAGGVNPWITHALGRNWLAAGVRFTTYQLLDSTALLIVEFGNELTIALLGISTARFPTSASQQPYAQIQLQLRALLRPTDGFFSITANLTRNSFLIDPACVLTGGFAFSAWFNPSPNAGDFVVVLGGYHPNFTPPAYYPTVPALGFSWSLDSTVSIAGTAYFALTPSAIMAGGALAVRYHDGSLTAWFTAHADLIVTWSPFHFLAGIGVSIGVDYTVNLLFTTKTLHLEAGANLTLWGPPTGGVANVRLWVVSFTVSFGAPQSPNQQPLTWSQFQALLPAPGSTMTFTATAGLMAQQTDNATVAAGTTTTTTGAAAPAPWQVRSEGFAFSVRSAVPSTNLFLTAGAQAPFQTGSQISIRPMRQAGLTVALHLSITVGGGEISLLASGWTVTASTANVPKALWGTGDGSTLDPGNNQLVTGQLTGLALQAPAAAAGASAGSFPVASTLGIDPVSAPGLLPVQAGTAVSGDVPAAGQASVAAIAGQIATTGAAARDQLYQALTSLGAAPATNGPLTGLAAQAGALFPDQPLLVAAGP